MRVFNRPVAGESGLEMDYIVWYRERSASEWRTMKILSRGVTEATVGGLRPNTEYELRVLSQDAIGDGLFSKPIFVRTHGTYYPNRRRHRRRTHSTHESNRVSLDAARSRGSAAGRGGFVDGAGCDGRRRHDRECTG